MNTLNQEDSLLLMIDVQEKLVATLERNTIVEKSSILIQAANLLGIPVLLTEQYPKGLGSTVEDVSKHFGSNTTVVEKTVFSAVSEPEIAEKIQSYGKKQIVILGMETHICVHQTVTALLNLGYEVYVVKDACSSHKKPDFKQGIEMMAQNGAKITCVEATVFEWLKSSRHPQFKAVQALIK